MGNPINEITKGLKAVETFQNIMLKPQAVEAFNRMSASVERLSGQLTSLNSAVLDQTKQIGESIKETKQQTIELRLELEKLNDVNSKSHDLFKDMQRSADITDKLNRIMVVFTIVAASVGLYPIYTDILNPAVGDGWMHAGIAVTCIITGIVWYRILDWALKRQGKTAPGK